MSPKPLTDFLRDWKHISTNELISRGYQVAANADVSLVTRLLLNVCRRDISARPRTVHRSDVLSAPTTLTAALSDLLSKASSGAPLTPHLSRRLIDADYEDPLLNDWGIHHFHLGDQVEADGFVNRTGPLLFAFVSDDEFHAIQVYAHGAWSNKELIEIIHRNWPSRFDRYVLKGVRLVTEVSSNEISQFRKAGLLTMVSTADGTTYAPMGGGYAADGSSLQVTIEHDRLMKRLRAYEKSFSDNFTTTYLPALAQKGVVLTADTEFRLEIDPAGKAVAINREKGIEIELGPI